MRYAIRWFKCKLKPPKNIAPDTTNIDNTEPVNPETDLTLLPDATDSHNNVAPSNNNKNVAANKNDNGSSENDTKTTGNKTTAQTTNQHDISMGMPVPTNNEQVINDPANDIKNTSENLKNKPDGQTTNDASPPDEKPVRVEFHTRIVSIRRQRDP